MKKIITIIAVIAIAAGIVFYVKSKKEKPVVAESSIVDVPVKKGSLVKSVEASGSVTSNLDVEIKCKASGEIITLPYEESDFVEKGSLVLELDPEDENRNVSKAEVSLASAKARLEKAKQSLDISTQDLENSKKRARTTLEATRAKTEDTISRESRTKDLYEKRLASKEELDAAVTASVQARSDLEKAEITIDELKTQEISLQLKKQDVELARADLESAKINLDIAKQRLADTKVYAPIDGTVTLRSVQAGQIISSATSNVGGGTTVMTISDLSSLYIIASIDESDIGQIRKGQDVEITADAFPGRVMAGIVDRISPVGKNVSNVVVFEVRIEVLKLEKSFGRPGGADVAAKEAVATTENPEEPKIPGERRAGFHRREMDIPDSGLPPEAHGQRGGKRPNLLKPEMTTNVKVIIEQKDDAVYVPMEAVKRVKGQTFITVVNGDKTEDREVQIGIDDGINVEIVSGIVENDTIRYDEKASVGKWSSEGRGGSNPARMMRMH